MFGLGNPDRTDITIVLDRSGSMQAVHRQTVDGFEAFVDKQRKLTGDCRLTLVQFDTIYETVYRNRPIHKVGRLDLQPRGATALLDAMGRAIQDTAARIAVSWTAKPSRVIVVTITDGLENSSREFTREQVFDLVQHQTDRCDWQFVFLGANQDAIREAANVGIQADAAMTYCAGVRGTANAWSAVGEAIARHRRSPAAKMEGSYFTQEERASAKQED
jgi:hypothetical protein